MNYKFRRSFLPIGQGAFYLEEHWSLGEEKRVFTAVYDCGSQRSKTWIEKRINYCLKDKRLEKGKGFEVDVLFLSHYHEDHYKGIEFLRPKAIVLPLLNELDKLILSLGKELGLADFNKDYDHTLKTLFPDARFIYVKSLKNQTGLSQNNEYRLFSIFQDETLDYLEVDSQDFMYELLKFVQKNAQGKGREETMEYSSVAASFPIENSGEALKLINCPKGWNYIPVNSGLGRSVVNRLQKQFSSSEIKKLLKAIRNCSSLDKTLLKELKRFYRAIGNPNEYSMALYSGPSRFNNSKFYVYGQKPIPITMLVTNNLSLIELLPKIGLGCLYLGDIKLKEINDTIFSKTLKDIYKALPYQIVEDLSTIQVPHHGSKENYNFSLLCYYDKSKNKWERWDKPMIYIISAGKNNKYGHPSAWVMNELMHTPNMVRIVSEDEASIFVEEGELSFEGD